MNALCAAETMKGRDGNVADAFPVEKIGPILSRNVSNIQNPYGDIKTIYNE